MDTIKLGITERKPAAKTAATKPVAAKSGAKKASPAMSARISVDKKPVATGTSRALAPAVVTAEDREKMISLAAYVRAERRGFVGGDPVVDWLDAEAEIDAMLGRWSH